MQNKTRTQEISALGHFLIQNSSESLKKFSFLLRSSYNNVSLQNIRDNIYIAIHHTGVRLMIDGFDLLKHYILST